MKKLILLLFLLISSQIYSQQQFNIGAELGDVFLKGDYKNIGFGGEIEYKPRLALISFNFDPILNIPDKNLIFTLPIYLRFIIGNKIKFCPEVGVFYRSNRNYGWTTGLIIEMMIKDRLYVFVKGDYYRDYWKAVGPYNYQYLDHASSGWISIGIKKNILG